MTLQPAYDYPSLPDEIKDHFLRFGPLTVDWPHKAQSKAYFPPKGTTHPKDIRQAAHFGGCLICRICLSLVPG
jgi:hypothetical protein